MRLALAQINPLIGDLSGNKDLILTACEAAVQQKADLIVTPELSLWGYPPRDLLLDTSLLETQTQILDEIVNNLRKFTREIYVLIGIAEHAGDMKFPFLFNATALVDKKGWNVIARKQLLPTYDVFDEKRYFRPGISSSILKLPTQKKIWRIGITICEDLWVEENLQGHRVRGPDPIENLVSKNPDLLINLSASPFSQSKDKTRHQIAAQAVRRLHCPIAYLNQVGGNDELVFDGASFVLDSHAELILRLPSCSESLAFWEPSSSTNTPLLSIEDPFEKLFKVLVLGVKDYVKKCGFAKVLLGLSGGIDSALVAVIATYALGADNVTALLMPSPWSSEGSIKDSNKLAKRLRIHTETVPITALMDSYWKTLKQPLGKDPEGITAENLQSRIRGTLLMAYANQEGQLLLSTGNKSELAVGYCTLYGDMNGGLAVIGDLYKTTVFNLSNWLDSPAAQAIREEHGLENTPLIGDEIRKKAPSAELKPDQLDINSLPEYAILDRILKALIEKRKTPKQLIDHGEDPKLVKHIQNLMKKAEFKRKQAPPLLKVSNQAFGTGWRIPIATS